jgi:hypothetical protein
MPEIKGGLKVLKERMVTYTEMTNIYRIETRNYCTPPHLPEDVWGAMEM